MSMDNATAAAPSAPSGPVENRGPAVLAVSLSMIAFSTVFVVLRCVSRIGLVKRWTLDDTFIIIAWLISFGFTFSICWGVRNGLGLHEVDISPDNQLALRKSEYAFSVLYNPVLMATKTSILCFYLTLARDRRLFRWATWATIFIVNAAGLGLTLFNVFQCRPMWTLFSPTIPDFAVCTDLVVIYLSSAPVNIVTDLIILVLPFPVLTKMRLPRKQKLILIVTFSFGAFVAVVDVVRIAYLQQAFETRLKEVGKSNSATSKALIQDDFSWYASLSFLWSGIEVHIGLICACVPSLKPLVARVLPRMLRDTSDPNDRSAVKSGSQMRATHPTSNTVGSPLRSPMTIKRPAHIAQFGSLTHDGTSSPASSRSDGQPAEDRENSNETHGYHEQSHPNMTGADGTGSAHGDADADTEMDFMDFLTTPDMEGTLPSPRSANLASITTRSSMAMSEHPGNVPFFDFYQMETKKPMTRLSNKQSLAPLVATTILFFLWGFAYGLLDVLNAKFAEVNNLTTNQALGLHAAYFGAYAFGPSTVGRWTFLNLGFRATFIAGLSIYALGTMIFWPAAVLSSYPTYVICNFINGFGVSILEVAANPFVALCGPPRYAETRLNLSQGVQAIGTVVAPLLATKVLFSSVTNGGGLIDVQWAYLGISLFDVCLAVVFYYLPLPEATDDDFERVAEKRQSANNATVFGFKVIYVTLAFGVFSEFCYVGAQEIAGEAYQNYIRIIAPNSTLAPFDWQTVGHTTFAIGRFVTAGLGFFIRPRTVLLILYTGMIITAAVAMSATGPSGVATLVIYELFQSGVFSLIYAISLRGLGSFTKRGAILLTMSTSSGAIWPVVAWPVATARGVPYSFCTVVALSAFGTLYPLYMMITPQARNQVDAPKRSRALPTNENGTSPGERGRWMAKLWPGTAKPAAVEEAAHATTEMKG